MHRHRRAAGTRTGHHGTIGRQPGGHAAGHRAGHQAGGATTGHQAATSPQSAAPSWKPVDFRAVTDREMPDCPESTEVDSVHFADLTGDGRDEAIVAAACFTTTAQNPINVFVYDGTDRRAPLERLVTIGKDQYLQTAAVKTSGRTLTVTSNALSDRAPRCCPDLRITQKYQWTGSTFDTSVVEKPL